MTSKEFIKNYVNCIGSSREIKEGKEDLKLMLKVLKDLERLEALKKENAELKDQVAYLKEESENWQSAYEWSQTENSILKLENEELRSKYNDLMLDFKMFDFNTLKQENEKLKKTIEILKSFINYVEVEFDTFVTSQCSEDDYILLKEVFKNDRT